MFKHKSQIKKILLTGLFLLLLPVTIFSKDNNNRVSDSLHQCLSNANDTLASIFTLNL